MQSIDTVKGVGIDLVPVSRMGRLVERYDRQTLTLLFMPGEIDRCRASPHPERSFAMCFAAKEAVGKALGTGLVDIDWNEIEAMLIQDQLTIHLHGKANTEAEQSGIRTWFATWCDWDDHVLVHVLAI